MAESLKTKIRHTAARLLVFVLAITSGVMGVTVPEARASGLAAWTADGETTSETTNTGWSDVSSYMSTSTANSGPIVETSDGNYIAIWGDNDSILRAQKYNASGVAQWTAGGVTLYSSATETFFSEAEIVADEVGGAIAVFRVTGDTYYEIRAQRVGATGAYEWGGDGAAVVADGADNNYGPVVVADGSNGVIVSWMRGNFSTNANIHVQRLNGAGAQQWGATGTTLSSATNEQVNPVIVTDGSGGAIVGWEDHRNGDSNTDIYARRVNSAGTAQWTANGVAIGAANNNQDRMTSMTADGSGGAVLVWEDNRSSSPGVYAQKVNSAGTVQWTANGEAVTTAQAFLTNPKIAASGSDVFVAYSRTDGDADQDLFIQKLDSSGASQFAGDGNVVAATAFEDLPAGLKAAGDGSGDVLVSFVEEENVTSISEARVQKIESNGTESWSSGGVVARTRVRNTVFYPVVQPYLASNDNGDAVLMMRSDSNVIIQRAQNSDGAPQWNSTTGIILPNGASGTAPQQSPMIGADGSGNYFVAWTDKRFTANSGDIYAQKIDATGADLWTAGGVAVSTLKGDEIAQAVISDGSTGALILWTTGSDIRGIRLTTSGAVSGGWTSTGVVSSGTGTYASFNDVISDGSGGYILVFQDADNHIRAQRVTSAGSLSWGANGVRLTPLDDNRGHGAASMSPDGAGGAYIAWKYVDDSDTGSIRVTRIDASGAQVGGWTFGGTVARDEPSVDNPDVVAVNGGVAVVWDEDPVANRDIKAQFLNGSGVEQWTAEGVDVVTATDTQRYARAVASDTGIVVAWTDLRSGIDNDVYAQRLDSSGAPDWTIDGIVVSDVVGDQGGQNMRVDTDNADGIVMAWVDTRASNDDVYAQRVDVTGNVEWTADGIVIADRDPSGENEPSVVSNGDAGIVVAFSSENDDASPVYQIRVQQIEDSEGAGGGGGSNASAGIADTVAIDDNTANGPTLVDEDLYGISVTPIGDLNNDGVEDIAVGAFYDDTGGPNRGAIYIHFMNADGTIDSTVKIDDTTTNGPVLASEDRYGNSIANLGDLNDDGVIDLAVGASGDDTGGSDRGAVYIHFMNADGTIDSTVKIDDTTTNGPTLSDADEYGIGVTALGDLDGDGVEDLAVGAFGDDNGGSGRGAFHIHYLNVNGTIDSTVEINDGTANGATLADGDEYGTSLANLGDLNADGVIDLAVGAPGDDTGGTDQGAVYIHFMNANGSIDATAKIADGTVNGPVLAAGDAYGISVAGIGDYDEDGVEDIAVGSPLDDGAGTDRGAVFIHFLNTDGSLDSTVKIDGATANGPGISDGDEYGLSVAAIGDLDGDGVIDLAVGAPLDDAGGTDRGALFSHFMSDPGGASTDPTLQNKITMERLKIGTISLVDISFALQNELNGTITVTFPVGFTVSGAFQSGACSGGGTVDTFGFDGPSRTLTAEKHACSGTVTLNDATVTTPSTPGRYHITWINDDPGGGEIYIMDDDQVSITADVNATLTFDIDIQTTCGSESSAPYTVAFGSLSPTSVSTAASKICLDLDTNASKGAIVTVMGSGSVDGLESSTAGDSIVTAYAAGAGGQTDLIPGTEGYGLCVESTSVVIGSATGVAPYNGVCDGTSGHRVGGVDSAAGQQILTSNVAPLDGTTNDTAALRVKASISTTTAAANDYTDVLTFIATGTY